MPSCIDINSGGSSVSGSLSRIGQTIQGDSLAAQGWTELNSFKDNPFTHKDGIIVEIIGAAEHAVVDMAAIPKGQRFANSIPGLAYAVSDTQQRVLAAVLKYPRNAWLLQPLYQQVRGNVQYPGDATARRYLLRIAKEEYYPSGSTVTRMRYEQWEIPVTPTKSILLPPISARFRCDVFHDRVKAQQKKFKNLRYKTQFYIESIRSKTEDLKKQLAHYDRVLQPALSDISVITASRMLMDVMIKHPKNPNQAKDAAVEQHRDLTQQLENIAVRDFINSHKKDSVEATYKKILDDSALSLRKTFELRELITLTMTYRRYRFLIATSLYDQLCQAMSEAIIVLMRSPQKEYIKQHWLDRLLIIVDNDSKQQNTAEANVSIDDAVSACDGVLLGLSMVPAAVGNMPGPASFAVAMMDAFSHQLVGQAMAKPAEAKQLAQILVRFMVRWGGLNTTYKKELESMLANPPHQKTIGMWVKNRFQGSPNWGLFLGVFNAALLMHSIKTSETETIRDWITLGNLSLASSSGASFVQALKSIGRMRASGLVTIGGEALGVFAGVFAMLASIDAAQSESKTGDTHGAIVNYASAFGAGLSIAGYFIGAGLAADSTILGAPAGTVLMAVGIVIGVVSAVWSFIRWVLTTHTHIQYEAFINYLSATQNGAKKFAYILNYKKTDYPEFVATYEKVQKHHSLSFWSIAGSQCEILFEDILRDCQQVANALDLSKADMAKHHGACCSLSTPAKP